jgi:hypothetical protein
MMTNKILGVPAEEPELPPPELPPQESNPITVRAKKILFRIFEDIDFLLLFDANYYCEYFHRSFK